LERHLGLGLRVLLGSLGVIAATAGVATAAAEVPRLLHGARPLPAVSVALASALVTLGGATLVRGAWRGRVAVRRPGRRRPPP